MLINMGNITLLFAMSNNQFVDPIMRQVAAINLYDIDSRLRVTS